MIYDSGQLVGFIMAAFAPEHQNPLFHGYLWRLNIGAGCQGRGYGRFAVEALCHEAIRRGQHRLTVCYHPYQHGPEGFYRRLGFHPAGEHNEGEVIAERILFLDAAARTNR